MRIIVTHLRALKPTLVRSSAFLGNSRFKLIFWLLVLLIPPSLPTLAVYLYTKEDIHFLGNFTLLGTSKSGMQISTEEVRALADAMYAYGSSQADSQVSMSHLVANAHRNDSDYSIRFREQVSDRFANLIDILSVLPHYKVCLINRNVVTVDPVQFPFPIRRSLEMAPIIDNKWARAPAPAYEQAALALDPSASTSRISFYAPVERRDCKNVVLDTFLNSTSSVSHGYPIVTIPLKSEDGSARTRLATTTVDMSNSTISLRVTTWALVIMYVLFLSGWLIVFNNITDASRFFGQLLK